MNATKAEQQTLNELVTELLEEVRTLRDKIENRKAVRKSK
jgi:hypothetical protein